MIYSRFEKFKTSNNENRFSECENSEWKAQRWMEFQTLSMENMCANACLLNALSRSAMRFEQIEKSISISKRKRSIAGRCQVMHREKCTQVNEHSLWLLILSAIESLAKWNEINCQRQERKKKFSLYMAAATATVWFFLERWNCTLNIATAARKEWETNTIPLHSITMSNLHRSMWNNLKNRLHSYRNIFRITNCIVTITKDQLAATTTL